jgi:hypothetical protein
VADGDEVSTLLTLPEAPRGAGRTTIMSMRDRTHGRRPQTWWSQWWQQDRPASKTARMHAMLTSLTLAATFYSHFPSWSTDTANPGSAAFMSLIHRQDRGRWERGRYGGAVDEVEDVNATRTRSNERPQLYKRASQIWNPRHTLAGGGMIIPWPEAA